MIFNIDFLPEILSILQEFLEFISKRELIRIIYLDTEFTGISNCKIQNFYESKSWKVLSVSLIWTINILGH